MPISVLATIDAAEQPVAVGAADHHDREQRADQGVEPGEEVGADDLADGARRRVGNVVDQPLRDPFGDLGDRQSGRRLLRSLVGGRGRRERRQSRSPANRTAEHSTE